jgi:hypothetical protein
LELELFTTLLTVNDDKGNMISRGQIQRSITCTEAAAQSPEHPLMLCQNVHDIANKDSI